MLTSLRSQDLDVTCLQFLGFDSVMQFVLELSDRTAFAEIDSAMINIANMTTMSNPKLVTLRTLWFGLFSTLILYSVAFVDLGGFVESLFYVPNPPLPTQTPFHKLHL